MTITTQSFLSVGVGSSANDGTGDDLRTAFQKVNANFGWMGNTGFVAANVGVSYGIETNQATVTGNLVVGNGYVPTSNTATGTAGQIVWDSGNVYICVATNTWKRAALTSTF